MYVKLPPGELNFDPYPPHLTSIYTCRVTIAPRMRGGTSPDTSIIEKSVEFMQFCLKMTHINLCITM